jgi:PAS domain S-box-containing protein
MELERQAAAFSGAPRGGGADATAKQASILVVDDRRENLVALEALLEPLGSRVVTAGSGEEGLRAVLREDFAVILLDVQMPDLDGLEVARTIRSRPRSAGVPIIFLTAVHDEAEQVFAGYGSGAVDYIVKPVDPFILRSKVSVFIDLWTMSRALRDQAELEAAHESLALAQRAGESGFWDWDLAVDRIHWSPEYADLHGVPDGAAPSRDGWLTLVHPDDRDRIEGNLSRLLEGGETWDEEFRVVHPARGERWIRGKGKVYRDRAGKPTRFVGIDVDVTEHRAAQERLRQIEQQRALVGELGALLDGGVGIQERLQRLSAFLSDGLGMRCTVDLVEADDDPVGLRRTPPAGTWESPAGEGATPSVVIPMIARGRGLGVITVLREAGEPPLTDLQLELLELVAARAAVAIENALLFEREHQIATELQRTMLPAKLPTSFGIRVSACYVPSEADLDVGGDWYDAFPLEDGRLVSFVGDVVGHGVPAASAMGQLRSAIRALGPTSSGPADLLTRLDRFAADVEGGEMATVVAVEVDAERQSLRYACAGHPPPLLVLPDGAARFLEGGRSAPLASFAAADRGESQEAIPAGATVVLYSDGLVERRDEPIDDGLARLLASGSELVAGGIDLSLDPRVLVDAMFPSAQPRDDVCVLCVGLPQVTTFFRRELDASPEELRPLREALQLWLAAMGVLEPDSFEVLLATSEAAANAIEHGHRSDGRAGIVVELDLSGDVLRTTVRDAGRWREPVPTLDRGRGLALVRDIMEAVHVDPSPHGTVVTMERHVDTLEP